MFLRRLVSIVVRPRATMREILEAPVSERTIVLLVLLAILSAILRGFTDSGKISARTPAGTWLLIAGFLAAAAAGMLLLFYAFSWIAYTAGRFLEGTGEMKAVRAAMAWGLAPIIWAIVYRLPAALFAPAANPTRARVEGHDLNIQAGMFGAGCLVGLLFLILELAVLAWYLMVASQTLAEAHRYSAWRGLGTLAIVGVTPIVIMIAAAISLS